MSAESTWSRGDWMQTFTGRRFYPLSPRAEDGGHVDRFYSVAEHCVLMPDEVHDADNRILLTERNALMSATRERWAQEDLGPLPVTIHAWSPPEAERRYTRRLGDLLAGAR